MNEDALSFARCRFCRCIVLNDYREMVTHADYHTNTHHDWRGSISDGFERVDVPRSAEVPS